MEQKLTRRAARESAFKAAFAATFSPEMDTPWEQLAGMEDDEIDAFGRRLLGEWASHREEIDGLIASHLKGWTMQRLPRVSLAALRIALSEMLYGDERLPSVAINEAVELTKTYGGEGEYQFVNGILGVIVQELALVEEKPAPPAPQR